MRRLGTMVFAFIVSFLVASAFGTAVVLLLRGDDSYVPVVFAAGIVAAIAAPLLAVASLFAGARRAVGRAAWGLILLLGLLAFGIAAVELGAQGTLRAASRGAGTAAILFASCALAVWLQGGIFRSDARRRQETQEPPVRFGRGAAPRTTR
jgi:hypothetical protein